MQCEEFEDRINAVLDQRRRPDWDPELSLHCETCPECRKLAESYEHVLDGFYALTAPEAPRDLALRVLVDLQHDRAARPSRFNRRTAVLAIAAALLVAVGPLLHTTPEQQVAKQTTAPQAASTDTALAAQEIPLVPELLSITYGSNGDPMAGLAKGTGQGLANVILYVPGIGGGKGIMDVPPPRVANERVWTKPVSEGLRPITVSMTETLDLLIENSPVSQLATRS